MKFNRVDIERSLSLRTAYFESVDSTSLLIQRQIRNGEEPFELVVAQSQTNGQGRVGKSFYSPSGTGLYLTFCMKENAVSAEHITPRIALAVCHTIEELFCVSCGVKWVNDIYISNRKVAGILCQKVRGYYLFGIGINVEKPSVVPPELQNRFGFVTENENPVSCVRILKSLYQHITLSLSMDVSEAYEDYCSRCVHLEKLISITVNSVEKKGVCLGISKDFSLIVKTDDGIEDFSSGIMSILE